jgi:hypothetical protein
MTKAAYDRNVIVLETARPIKKQEISINDLYEVLGVDLDEHRVDAGDVISELSGIFTGWNNPAEG